MTFCQHAMHACAIDMYVHKGKMVMKNGSWDYYLVTFLKPGCNLLFPEDFFTTLGHYSPVCGKRITQYIPLYIISFNT